MKFVRFVLFLLVMLLSGGCLLTKVVTVPMRAGGAVISAVPVAGDVAHDAVDVAADAVD